MCIASLYNKSRNGGGFALMDCSVSVSWQPAGSDSLVAAHSYSSVVNYKT